MVTPYDYTIIVLFLLFLGTTGWMFRRMARQTTDYFAGGHRMTWWLLGAGSFISNVSCWSFTGAANVAYTYGVIIFGFYFADVLAYGISYVWFAPRFRQLRLITAMDAVRLRFGASSEQFFNWLGFVNSLGVASVWMVSMAIILSSAFHLDPVPVLVGSGIVIILVALLGGNWAVMASDFVQLLVLMGVTVVVAFLTIAKVGGLGAFIDQIPDSHWTLFHPAGVIPYDWLYLVTYAGTALYMKNSVVAAGKYIAAKDSRHARWSALVPFFGYIVMPVIWMIPAFAAFTLVPDLKTQSIMAVPGEAAYISVCLAILPQGLIGLIIVCMFAVTVSSMDMALNKNAGMFVRNFYRPVLRPKASDAEQVVVGKVATVVFGVLITMIALLVMTRSRVSLFDAFLYLGAYLGVPLSVPLFMGMLVRSAPRWAGIASVCVGMMLTTFIYVLLPSEWAGPFFRSAFGDTLYSYALSNRFVMTNLVTAPLTTLFFWLTSLLPGREARAAHPDVRTFFTHLATPVDFEKEVGSDNSVFQARMIGRLALVYGGLISLIVFVPNSLADRMAILVCGLIPLGVGTGLLLYVRARQRRGAT